MSAQEVAGLDRAIDRWSRAYWTLGVYVWSALYAVAYFTDTEPTTRNHVFLVAILHWATRDILAALKARSHD